MNTMLVFDDNPGTLTGTTGFEWQLWQTDTEPESFDDRRRYDPRLGFYLFKRQGALVEKLPRGAMVSSRLGHGLQQVMQHGRATATTLQDGYASALTARQQLDT